MRHTLVAALLLTTSAAAGCSTGTPSGLASGPRVISVAATINVWGSVLAQLGGVHVHETSIVTNPDTDPHDYEPTPADARTVASARLLVMNGVGYDQWAAKAVAANPNSRRTVIDVGRLVGAPTGGNPHRWYDPHDVELVADAITADLKRLDPADAAYFDERRDNFNRRGWARYGQLVGELASTYAGTRVGASESIFAPLAAALHLDLVTPVTFLTAISEGAEPSAADKATTDRQIRDKQIAVYVYNSQNATPDVTAQLKEARAEGIAVVAVTETLSPASASFQDWQLAQLEALRAALRQATGR